MIYFLDVSAVLEIHNGLVKKGCSSVVLNYSALESSVKSVSQTWEGKDLYPTLIEKICRLVFNLVTSHPFEDGNKRVGAIALSYLLEKNNFYSPTDDELEEIILALASSTMTYYELLETIEAIQ